MANQQLFDFVKSFLFRISEQFQVSQAVRSGGGYLDFVGKGSFAVAADKAVRGAAEIEFVARRSYLVSRLTIDAVIQNRH